MRSIISTLVIWSGCGGQGGVTDRYVPFDQAVVTAARHKIAVFDKFHEALEAKDFAAIQSSYETNFRGDLKALGAAHSYVSEGNSLGMALDQQVEAAITLGAGTSELSVKEAAEEIVQTIVLRYTFEMIYGELKKSTPEGWDRAFAYYGRSTDGKTSAGIARQGQQRDTEFATQKNDTVFQAFIDGHNALVQGDSSLVTSRAAAIDQAVTEIFGLSAHHEFAEAAEAISENKPEEAVEGFAVGKGIVTMLRDYLKTRPNGAATVAAIDAELGKGDPTQAQTMAQVKFTTLVSALDTTFGFKL